MRVPATGGTLRARAIAGSYVVILAWDTLDGKKPARADLLGFAIERTELNVADHVVERYWLRGIKRFRDKDKGLPPGTPVSTADHPIQTFQWGDYTARAATKYRYRIVPLYGKPKQIQSGDADAVTVEVITEPVGSPETADQIRHDVFFNRGVIGSQAYAREFDNAAPDPDNPGSRQMKWLSRGLYEAMVRFIALAKDGFKLRGAFYEFHYQPVVNAFAAAVEGGRGREDRVRRRELVQGRQSHGDRPGGPQGARRRDSPDCDRGHPPQQVHGAHEGRRAALRVDRLDEHLCRRHLRPFQRGPRRVGQGRRPEIPRLLGPARQEPDPDQAPRAKPSGVADAAGPDAEEQHRAVIQCPRRQGREHDAAVVRGSDERGEGRSCASRWPSTSTRCSRR